MKYSSFRILSSFLFAAFIIAGSFTNAHAGFLYVLNQINAGPNQIYCFRVTEATGSLDLVPGFPISSGGNGLTGTQSELLTIDKANNRLYVINKGSNTVSAFNINIATGALNPMPFSPFTVVTNAVSIAVHPSGSPVIIGGNTGTPLNGQYLADSYLVTNSAVTRAAGGPFNTGGVRPFSSAFSKDGSYFYYGGGISYYFTGFGVDAGTGALSTVPGVPLYADATNPLAFATDSLGRVFSATRGDGVLHAYTTSGGTPTQTLTYSTGLTSITDGELSPNEAWYVVVDQSSSVVASYQVTGSGAGTGFAPQSTVGTNGNTANGIVFNQTGSHIFAPNSSSRSIARFTFNQTTGAIALLGVTPQNSVGTAGFLAGVGYIAAAPPTAAGANVSGRVTNSDGRPIKGVRLTMSDAGGNTFTALTNPFGYFSFVEVRSGATYMVNASAKGQRFDTRVVTVGDDLTNLDITALP